MNPKISKCYIVTSFITYLKNDCIRFWSQANLSASVLLTHLERKQNCKYRNNPMKYNVILKIHLSLVNLTELRYYNKH